MTQTLLLNINFDPLKIIPWQRAMTMFYEGKVEIFEEYEDKPIRAVSFTFKMPSIVRMLHMVKVRRRLDYVPFTRGNIYASYGYRCQYCGHEYPSKDLTFDHVIPVSQGGKKGWDNIVPACMDCNRKKDNRTPEQAGMHLLRKPHMPKNAPIIKLSVGIRHAPESWRDFLYWNVELEEQ